MEDDRELVDTVCCVTGVAMWVDAFLVCLVVSELCGDDDQEIESITLEIEDYKQTHIDAIYKMQNRFHERYITRYNANAC